MTGCILHSETRGLESFPLFIGVSYIEISSYIVVNSDKSFDLAYSSTGFTFSSIPTDKFTLLQSGHLLRYGTSTAVYCHLNGSVINSSSTFLEDWCGECDTSNCFITIQSYLKLVTVDLLSQISESNSKRDGTTLDENIILIHNKKISIGLVGDGFILNIKSDGLVEITTGNITKKIFIVSDSKFLFENTLCQILYIENGIAKCIKGIQCEQGGADLLSGLCRSCKESSCLICTDSKDNYKCEKCGVGYINFNGTCVDDFLCEDIENGRCKKCTYGYVVGSSGLCEEPTDNCLEKKSTECVECLFGTILKEGKCVSKSEGDAIVTGNKVISCNSGFYLENNICKECESLYTASSLCGIKYVESCKDGYKLEEKNNCVQIECQLGEVKDSNGNCTKIIDKCITIENGMCIECEKGMILDNWNNKCITTQLNGNCSISGSLGCYRCIDGKFLNAESGICDDCGGNCSSCFGESTKCTACKDGYFLSNNACVTNEELLEVCNKISAITRGCVECRDGYYRNGTDCNKCDVKCATCNTKEICLTCNSTNFLTSDNECESRSNIVGCGVEVTKNGCAKCVDGYFTFKTNQCKKCVGCASCVSETVCTSCDDSQILHETSCVDVVMVKNCVEVKKSKCTKCTFWHEASESGEYCYLKAVWWVFFISSLIFVIILVVALVIIVLSVQYFVERSAMKSLEAKVTTFNMERSNVKFVSLHGGVCVNTKVVDFNTDIEEIGVCEETRQLLCVGNLSERAMKVQMSVNACDEQFSLRITPSVVTIHKGCASEFELFLTPNYTTKINTTIALVTKSIESGDETVNNINMKANTEVTTRLDPNELEEEKQIGEGSFGVVFIGTFRGNKVAIKKLKQTESHVILESEIDEFEKEVQMLDKFRSEHIVHFYGAVFVSHKICIVTEFAKHGSLMDLIKKTNQCNVEKRTRVKIGTDAARGIQYLHRNGILHRDIKPDNILVVSMDWNDSVFGKLTDFGSARNVNMLMTNMTFTKGIGTPIYMAPEILNQEKYKKEADIFSFGVTLYECLSWSLAYQPPQFKFPWEIADFVNNGKRLKQHASIQNHEFGLIVKMWEQNPSNRFNIDQVVECFEHFEL
ncbi:protein serine/threonine kinase, putative [Entamoeba invadens IP1]|uniref:protein serine/threonine kinase, putative n=1 Tax=Entamoeba invadens IP1 TaxID=370355 RepID=UPI0002C3D4E2|nr:protein serine/threonine kinase, putative [Entamoeba invadens IP1]ELP90569.1 protein serine/threonine kinase, putative [Entamoeba invadens IP1]|eukprot:XP_004257340.1 protein serine/threonine kinase, putative [Entamoeba invadens IP1]